jgi:hypothetical protein
MGVFMSADGNENEIEYLQRQITRLVAENMDLRKKLEEKGKHLGRFVLMNDGDALAYADEPTPIYDAILRAIKGNFYPPSLIVMDAEMEGKVYSWVEFLYAWDCK